MIHLRMVFPVRAVGPKDVWDGFGAETANVIGPTVDVQTNVGGESLPINTIGLLVAGTQVNAIWLLPILGLVGTIISIRKLEAKNG